jgi:hypothetical protein
MGVFSKTTVIALGCATAMAALTATPSPVGAATPADKPDVSTAAPTDSVHDRSGASSHRHHHHRPAGWGWNQRRVRLQR